MISKARKNIKNVSVVFIAIILAYMSLGCVSTEQETGDVKTFSYNFSSTKGMDISLSQLEKEVPAWHQLSNTTEENDFNQDGINTLDISDSDGQMVVVIDGQELFRGLAVDLEFTLKPAKDGVIWFDGKLAEKVHFHADSEDAEQYILEWTPVQQDA